MTTPFHLHPHDRIVFYGDSITEQQLYTNYVESYLASRYPELKLTFFNAGWGGDTAPGAVRRLERDVLSLNPTVVTLCFGMNDGRYCPPTDEIRATYVVGMRDLVARLKAAGVRPVLLTPGMVDERQNPSLGAAHYNQGGLRILADEVLKLAAHEELPVYDLHKLMNDVDARAKAATPDFCMIPDSVHPDPAGHLVMAYGLLCALGVPPRQQAVTVDCAAGTVTAGAGLQVGRYQKEPHGFGFSLRLDSLPFFVEPDARKVLPYLPFQETFNMLRLVVHDLPNTLGIFRYGGCRSSAIPCETFAHGINLFDQWAYPAQQQAASLHAYTRAKVQTYYQAWRILGLNGQNSAYYNAPAHRTGIKAGPVLDRAREKFLGRAALESRVQVIATDEPGEPIHNGDFLSQWSFSGPFPKPFADDRLGGEAAFSAAPAGLGSTWCEADVDLTNPGNALAAIYGPNADCFVYALTQLTSPVAQDVELLLGSDDGVAVWFNGEQVWDNLLVNRGVTVDQDRVTVTLKAGTNYLLLKISQGGGGWGFCARFAGLQQLIAAQRVVRCLSGVGA
jgi:lysophospholipase L1-like esterase